MSFHIICISFALFIILSSYFVSGECPGGWKSWGNKCYYMRRTTRTFSGVERYCREIGGEMLTIDSKEENQYVQKNFRAITAFLGARRIEGTDKWVWHDGRPIEYFNWNHGEPNNWQKSENCIQYYNNGPHAGYWNDYSCTEEDYVLCQIVLNREKPNEPSHSETSKPCDEARQRKRDFFSAIFKFL